ncbi:MAG: tRNA lysidine(34) synthetase TilS [Nocardioides sp.]
MSLDPAVAAVRLAVRRDLADVGDHDVLVACSGGADSLALLAATVFEARAQTWRVIGVSVDHGLQDGSTEHTDHVVAQMARLGVDETVAARVTVESGGRGIEAAAREARYAVLEEVAQRLGSRVVLLGHTLDDQAETVLLGLTRGSGGRSIAGMRPTFDDFRRPLLDITREQTETACRAEGIEWWEDPHNADPRFTRSRVRHTVLPMLERELGPGVAETLARTAGQLRRDMEALDRLAAASHAELDDVSGLLLKDLHQLDLAIASRVLRLAALDAGAPASELFHVHVASLVALAEAELSGEVQLPGKVTAFRSGGRLQFRPTT